MSDSNINLTADEATVQALIEGLQEGATIKDLKGVSDDLLEGIYAFAHRFYCNGQLEEAEAFFRFLCLYDFYNGEYALGLGAVHQMKGEYQRAIDMYALAYALLGLDYRPMLHTGQCQLALGKVSLARECFDIVITHSQDATQVARATAYLQAIAQADPLPEKDE
jgi:type III secretion system low calcium response chaperone LcrH/SycD